MKTTISIAKTVSCKCESCTYYQCSSGICQMHHSLKNPTDDPCIAYSLVSFKRTPDDHQPTFHAHPDAAMGHC